MTKTAKDLRDEYVSAIGHDLSFCVVEKDGKSYIVMNNNLLPTSGEKADAIIDVPSEEIKTLKVIRGTTLDERLDVLAELTVLKGIPTDIVIKTTIALCALFNLEPQSKETEDKIDSMPDRIQAQPDAVKYMLFVLMGGHTSEPQPKPTLH